MCGIVNIENNCFLSSIVQMLTVRIDIMHCFDKEVYNKVFWFYRRHKKISIPEFIRYYHQLNKEYVIGNQQDAHEALTYILDDATDKTPFKVAIKQKVFTKNGISETITYENILTLPLKQSFQESIDSFFENVQATETTMNLSEDISEVTYTPKIEYEPANSPDFLFVTLNRFNNTTFAKDSLEIIIPDYIEYNSCKYKIIASVYHSGTTLSGHYVTIKEFDWYVKKDWYFFNDHNFFMISDQKTMQSRSYIFLLEKCDFVVVDLTCDDNMDDDLTDCDYDTDKGYA